MEMAVTISTILEKIKILEIGNDSINNQETDDKRKNILEVELQSRIDLQSFPFICFLDEVIKTPTVANCTEETAYKRANWKHKVTYKEILKIHYTVSGL